MSTATSAGFPQCYDPTKGKLNLQTYLGVKKSVLNFSLSPSSLKRGIKSIRLPRSSVVCRARDALDQGQPTSLPVKFSPLHRLDINVKLTMSETRFSSAQTNPLNYKFKWQQIRAGTTWLGSENPVLVEFWAPWCGPCRMIIPVIAELAREHAGKIACYKLYTDDCPNIATQYGIRSIPTARFFKNGEKKESVIGVVPKSTLSETIEK